MYIRSINEAIAAVIVGAALALCLASCQKQLPASQSGNGTWMEIQKSMSDKKPLDPPGIEMLVNEHHYLFEGPDAYTVSRTRHFKILTENAREEYGVWTLDYHPWFESKPTLRITVTQPDGAVVELDRSTVVDQSTDQSGQLISNGRRITVPLPQLKIGSVVKFSSSRTIKPSVYGPAMSGWMHFGSYHNDVGEARLILEFPASMTVSLKQLAMDDQPVEIVANGMTKWVFERRNIKRIYPPETNIPEKMVGLPIVMFATGVDWNTLARSYHGRVAPVLDSASACEAEIKALIPGSSDGNPIDSLLANLKAKVRYTGLELGENAIVPVSPCETLKRGFGDCKDQAALLVTALRLMKVDASLALVNANYGLDVEPELPSLMEFNHVIVKVNGDKPMWIDPTLTYGRPGELAMSTQQRKALIISRKTKELEDTPSRKASENFVYEKRTIQFVELGNANIIEETSYSGAYERSIRSDSSEADEDSMFHSLEEYIKSAYKAKSLMKARRVDPADLSQPFKYWLEGEEIEVAISDLSNATAALTPWSLYNYLPNAIDPSQYDKGDTRETRNAPFQVGSPGVFTVEYMLKAPPEFVVKTLPADEKLVFGSFKLNTSFHKLSANTVKVLFTLDTGDGILGAKLYQPFRLALLKWAEALPIIVTFEHAAMGELEAGNYKKALAMLQKSEAADAQNHVKKLRYAAALLEVGFGGTAREAAMAATKLAPDDAQAWQYLGWILEHDDFGTRFGKGYARNKAIDAYERALSVEPEDVDTHFSLAILLEHDQDGDRYADVKDLQKAIVRYEKILELEEDNEDVINNLVYAMSYTEDYLKLRKFLDRQDDILGRQDDNRFFNTYRVLCTAAIDGAAAAISEAQRLFADVATRREALLSVVGNLSAKGQFADCAVLIREAAKGISDSNALAKAKLFEDIAGYKTPDQGAIGQGTPEKLAIRFLIELMKGENVKIEKYWVPSLRKWLPHDLNEEYEKDMAQSLASLRKQFESDTFVAMMASSFEVKQEGNDTAGYRLQLIPKLGNGERLTLYIIEEKGKYGLASLDDMGIVGHHVLQLLEENKLDAARKWLDWSVRDGNLGDQVVWKHNCEGDANRVKAAAWYIIARDGDLSNDVIPVIETAYAAATGEHRKRLERALYAGYRTMKRWDELAGLSAGLLESSTDKTVPFYYYSMAAMNSGRYDELVSVAKKMKLADPDERLYSITEGRALTRAGKTGEFWEMLSKETDALEASQYNLLAWVTLFDAGTLEQGLDFALKAVQKKERSNRYKYHTLATIYAELGKTAEARQIMKTLLANSDEPQNGDWFVLGRMAEHYNLEKLATNYYCNVESPKHHDAVSTYNLAQKRLKILRAKCKK